MVAGSVSNVYPPGVGGVEYLFPIVGPKAHDAIVLRFPAAWIIGWVIAPGSPVRVESKLERLAGAVAHPPETDTLDCRLGVNSAGD